MKTADLVIIGGGPAGMAAAVAARENGIYDIIIIERSPSLGGILNQCIHSGFGLHHFGEELTGPEYAARYETQVEELNIPYLLNTTVLDISSKHVLTVINEKDGVFEIQAKAVVLAMGCRERSRGALNIPGSRPAGIYTAGAAQRFVNIRGYMPGKKAVILGSGDIGLIMARRMTLEGAEVKAVCEVMPYSGGLRRNIEQCLHDFNIPLYLSHTVTKIHGVNRITGVTVSQVDEKRQAIAGTEMYFDCDTLLLSVGLIPENELSKSAGVELDRITGGAIVDQNRQTLTPGIFACGNVLHVHDLVDFVSEESALAGKAAAEYIKGILKKSTQPIPVRTAGAVRYTVPQFISDTDSDINIFFRVNNEYRNVIISVSSNGNTVLTRKKVKVAPGEMESVKLKAFQLAKCSGDITVSVEAK